MVGRHRMATIKLSPKTAIVWKPSFEDAIGSFRPEAVNHFKKL